MQEVRRLALRGYPVVGICNGFQVLTEAGLLPGALLANTNLHFTCKEVFLRVERTDLPFTRAYTPGQVLRIPIAHGEGRYYADAETLNGSSKTTRWSSATPPLKKRPRRRATTPTAP